MESPDNRILAELVGILLGDGSIGVYSYRIGRYWKTQYRIKITLNAEKDFEFSKYVSMLCESVFHVTPKFYFRKGENTLDLYVLGKRPFDILIREGLVVAPKWGRAIIPQQFLEPPLDRFVLRGYMDTDGCVCVVNNNGIKYPRIEMKISPSPMQGQLISILARNGFQPQVNRLERGKVRIALSGLNDLGPGNPS